MSAQDFAPLAGLDDEIPVDGIIAYPKWAPDSYRDAEPPATVALAGDFPEPEDRGAATLSEMGTVEYVADLIRPGRIVVVAAEEGSGKSYAVTGELAIRVATAGGSFAGTWPILRQGPVLVLSEMHADDDYTRETTILEALDLERDALTDRYYRLPLASAAGDRPALQVPEWRDYITGWMRDRGVLAVVFDTATGAAQVDPWGGEILAVYRGLRMMLEQYPELAIVLIVHLKKPQGRGERRISDVLGEWGRWCDVLLLLERDGETRVKLSTRKRVRHERRIVATKAGGLLVDPVEMTEGNAPKVPQADVLAAVEATPGMGVSELAKLLKISRRTAHEYTAKAEADGLLRRDRSGPRGAIRLVPADIRPCDRAGLCDEHARTDDARLSQGDRATVRASIYRRTVARRTDDSPADESEDELREQLALGDEAPS